MPELPEVETIRRDLAGRLLGQSVQSLKVLDSLLMKPATARHFEDRVVGKPWTAIKRHGKYLWVELQDSWRILFHLRMTGQLVLGKQPGIGRCRLVMNFSNGEMLSFYDQRRFGEVRLLTPGDQQLSAGPLGPDALEGLTRDMFVRLMKHRTTKLHPLLLDQKVLAGVGNIYSQEALFRANLRPSKQARQLSETQSVTLFESLQNVLRQALELRGTSSRNYRDAMGQEGAAQTLHAVYRRGGKPCPRCETTLRVIRLGGRGTVYCPECQR